jgi:hypothetical protein
VSFERRNLNKVAPVGVAGKELRNGTPSFGLACRSFAFPNGDFCSESPGELRAAGYEISFILGAGTEANAAPLQIPRLNPPARLSSFAQQFLWR